MSSSAATFSDVDRFDNFLVNKSALRVRLNPLAVVTILDAFARRPKKESRAIGTLLGLVSEGNILDITDCFQVLHSDSAERGLLFNSEYHKRMCSLRHIVHPKEQVIGWFSVGTQNQIDENTVQVHNFYQSKESKFFANPQLNFNSPVFLSIDTTLRDCATPIDIKVFAAQYVSGTDSQLMEFYELPIVSGNYGGQESSIMSMLAHAGTPPAAAGGAAAQEEEEEAAGQLSQVDAFTRELGDLENLLKEAQLYIRNVISGEKKANPEVGRALMRALASENFLDAQKMSKLISGAMKDTLMVTYLSSMCKCQIALAEQIQGILSAQNDQ